MLNVLEQDNQNNKEINDMTEKTLERLKITCFGYNDCHHGECFHSALITLRFISTVSDDENWIKKLITYYNKYINEKYRHNNLRWYYWLCLSEMPYNLAKS